ncbi:glutathione S-transferase family protein [Sphingomonas sp. TX0543]|uniref:glutathione S-transferase family protein n=1 Tax=unclassified Sphingomonas TaxID=196159 RepID=UPI0010F5AE2A|nr:glutathione S-transferase family protein [Sphingomonas sp. 3P27F8]
MIELYHCRESRSLRPLWALEELGLPYRPVFLSFPPRLREKTYLATNPLGTVPYLIDGDVRMSESTAMCLYLTEKYGPTPLAISAAESGYANFLNWLFFSDATLTFPQTIVLRYRQFEPDPDGRTALDYEKWFYGRLKSVEAELSGREWLCGDRFTIADIAIVYALYLGDTIVGLGPGYGPNVRAYLERACDRSAFKRAREVDMQAPAWR